MKIIVEVLIAEARDYTLEKLREAGYLPILVQKIGSVKVHPISATNEQEMAA